MIAFARFRDGLYLTEASLADPSRAGIVFLFKDTTRNDPTYTLSAESWADPAQQGFFASFLPASHRDWTSFAAALRGSFAGTQNAQIGWFAESAGAVTAVSLIAIDHSAAPKLSGAISLGFRNITLSLQAGPFLPAPITFDDSSNAFLVANANGNALTLEVQPVSGAAVSFSSSSPALTLPMADGTDPQAGCVAADFAFAVADLAILEAGFMYFGPPQAGLLNALGFPFLRPTGGSAQPLGFAAVLDVLQPLVDTRSYFRCADATVGCYFTAANGQSFALATFSDTADQSSRLAFANRPVRAVTDASSYYLTPAGPFGLLIDGGNAPTGPVALLCGTAGTEFLSIDIAAGDRLLFTTGGAAYQETTPPAKPGDLPSFLSTAGGNVTTAWAQLLSTAGQYISQPQDSPLFDQQAGTLSLSASGLDLHLLNFLPLPSWSAAHATASALRGATPTPAVPMVPFAGLAFNTPDQAAPYAAMEVTALNPTRKNAFTAAAATVSARRLARGERLTLAAEADLTWAMTPPGLLAGLSGSAPNQVWQATRIAVSPPLHLPADPVYLQFTSMGEQIRAALQQNQIFLVISTLTDPKTQQALFGFAGLDQQINISGWPFSLSPTGTPLDGVPPIVILKFHPGQSLQSLVADTSLWSQADTFNDPASFSATKAQAYIQKLIAAAAPDGPPAPDSLYYNFYQIVTDPNWSGLLALNSMMQLAKLPTAIKAVTGGMTRTDAKGNAVSNIDAFRVHHVGVSINDTDPGATTPTLSQSALFGLVDYEKPAAGGSGGSGINVSYNFEVQFLRALFTNSELTRFSCKINLTINNLFGTGVTQKTPPAKTGARALAAADSSNVVVITGAYQAHSTAGSGTGALGEGVYSFVAEKSFEFAFAENPYLDKITLTKLQFSFQQETPGAGEQTSTIQASFGIWGALVFKQFDVLDIFSFKQLVFNDLGIAVSFDLTVPPPPASPSTANLTLTFNPGNLRLDLANSTPKEGSTSLLSLLPFKLTAFLYNQYPDRQTVKSLGYTPLTSIPLDPGFSLTDQFNYGLLFDLDLGRLGALVGSLEAFKFSFVIGWLSGNETTAGGIAFGVKLPEADGKLQIKIQGVLNLLIEQFILRYEKPDGGTDPMLVLVLHNASIDILGVRLPPGTAQFDFALFAPANDSSRIGWIVAVNNTTAKTALESRLLEGEVVDGTAVIRAEDAAEGDSPAFQLVYLGLGQRTGPDPASPPKTFADFMTFMTTTFWTSIQKKQYDKVYHPDSQWLAITNFKLLGLIEVGFVFYDVTPFYSLTLNVAKLFNFEITYTKVSDSIGLFYANFSLPDSLRTFEVGAASLTMPSIGVSVYTNGNWLLDVGFPKGDDWSRSFRVQAQAGPVPVTGSGGFQTGALSSATTKVFKGDYASILTFGFAARLGVGKDFVAGPLKAGVSVTFFGIIQGSAGYRIATSNEIFERPDALSLQGQFGVIGEIYGAVDFVIIKASVNVRLQASVGIILKWEPDAGQDGSILLYIEASVRVSASVEINLGLFSIKISFSFYASFRFDWQLLGPKQSSLLLALHDTLRATRRAAEAITILPLIPGFAPSLPIWFTPEGTVVFPDASGTGQPWVVCTLALQYDPAPATSIQYAAFKPFEQVTTQLVTWAVGQALGRQGWNFTVAQDELSLLDRDPGLLLEGIDYPTLLKALAVFSQARVAVPQEAAGSTVHAAAFPMFPFFKLVTEGRMKGAATDELSYVFASLNKMPTRYIDDVEAYFNLLFVNQSQQGAQGLRASADDPTTPLIQEIFFDYMTGLVRGALHQLLQTMQDGGTLSATIDAVILAAVRAGAFANLGGQMSSSFRGGARLPYAEGQTVPGGDALKTTNPLYALLWQEFPVGDFGSTGQYTITLSNPDQTQDWLSADAGWILTQDWLAPLRNIPASAVVPPSTPQQLPFTDVGPQAFAFQNPTVWTGPGGQAANLCPFPSSLQLLQANLGVAIAVGVLSRPAGAPYMPGGTPVPAAAITWATQITLSIAQVPDGAGGMLRDIVALAGASQQDEQLLGQILDQLAAANPIASIQILYQSAAGASGLTSAAINPADVFLLRTNTTSLSAPPSLSLRAEALLRATPQTVPVGAQIDETEAFLQILQQAVVTNATGYFLRYADASGQFLPEALFASGPAPLTVLITYKPEAASSGIQAFYNAIALTGTDPSLIYYAETTAPALSTQFSTVAPGAIGVLMTRDDSAMKMRAAGRLRATAGAEDGRLYHRSELIAGLVAGGVTGEAELHALLGASGSGTAQVNALYSLVTYQVQKSTGFQESPLSAPIQPQQPDAASRVADGLLAASDETRSYRVYVPLYNVAEGQPGGANPNRYLSIDAPVSIAFFQNDAFGNQMPTALPFKATNAYFDPILGLDQWQGIVPAYDFAGAAPNSFTITLAPSAQAFTGMEGAAITAALQTWTSIADQISAPGVSFLVETNLALAKGGSMVQVTLSPAQQAAITAMAQKMAAWLQDMSTPFPADPVRLAVSVTGEIDLPPAFEMVVLFGIARNPALISPLLKDQYGNVTFPSAQHVSTTVAPTLGASLPDGTSVSLDVFAAAFVRAFPALLLSVGLNGGQAPAGAQAAVPRRSRAARQARALRATGTASDGSGSGQAGPQSLWAVQTSLVQISIGAAQDMGPYYLSPKPLDNALTSGTVPLPNLPAALQPPTWPASQSFTDVDLDRLNATFFSALDLMLAPASAAQAFAQARAAYVAMADGRANIASLYASKEIDWLFPPQAPFTGSPAQWQAARDAFEQQMRAALATAYTTDTIVQYGVSWTGKLPAEIGDLYELFGTVVPTDGTALDRGFTLSSPHVAIPQSGPGLLTFLFGVNDIRDTVAPALDLSFNATHIQHFLAPADATPPGEARPSIWLQLVNPYATLPHLGPIGQATKIPLVFRQFPTPPTLVRQEALPGSGSGLAESNNPLIAAAAWHLNYVYQVPLTVHDQIITAVTYNTDMTVSGAAQRRAAALRAGPPVTYTLFEALARFSATYAVIQDTLTNLASPNWAAAAGVFAGLVTDVVTNSTWTPSGVSAFATGGLSRITDVYTVADSADAVGDSRLITLAWETRESSFPGATLAVQALDPQLLPYPNQVPGRAAMAITDRYTPVPPLNDDWIVHAVTVDPLNVLAAENALAAVQVERNLIEMTDAGGTSWFAQGDYVYMTPAISATQPITPFIDNTTPIDVATLPNQGIGSGCPTAGPPGVTSLCQRIYTMMYDLIGGGGGLPDLLAAHACAGTADPMARRVKMACSFQYPVASAGGVASANPVQPLVPVTLARSFLIDGGDPAQLADLSDRYAGQVAAWAEAQQVAFGGNGLAGAQFVFDITLYAELSGLNTPLLRLRRLQLKTADVTP